MSISFPVRRIVSPSAQCGGTSPVRRPMAPTSPVVRVMTTMSEPLLPAVMRAPSPPTVTRARTLMMPQAPSPVRAQMQSPRVATNGLESSPRQVSRAGDLRGHWQLRGISPSSIASAEPICGPGKRGDLQPRCARGFRRHVVLRGHHRSQPGLNAAAFVKVPLPVHSAETAVAAEDRRANTSQAEQDCVSPIVGGSETDAADRDTDDRTDVCTVTSATGIKQMSQIVWAPSPLTAIALLKLSSTAVGGHRVMPASFGSRPSSAAGSASGRHFRILCYGDSLTVGFCKEGSLFEPYGRTLAHFINASGFSCEVLVCGYSGHTAAEMVANADCAIVQDVTGLCGKGLRRILCDEGPIDIVLIMSGTNDLGHGASPLAVLHDVRQLHSICHTHGVATVALAPPASPATFRAAGLAGRRRDFVDHLMKWIPLASRRTPFIDPSDVMPRNSGSEHLWEPDGVHFSAAGSRLLGQWLAESAVLALIRSAAVRSTVGATSVGPPSTAEASIGSARPSTVQRSSAGGQTWGGPVAAAFLGEMVSQAVAKSARSSRTTLGAAAGHRLSTS